MQIYSYWARRAADSTDFAGRSYHLIAYAGSNLSPADAQVQADARLAERQARLQGREKLNEYPVGGRPLREKLEQRLLNARGEETAALTRNVYGALILNAKTFLILDIDDQNLLWQAPPPAPVPGLLQLLGRWLGLLPSLPPVPAAEPQLAGLPLLEYKIKRWLTAHPAWNFRLYRTRLGYRLLATHAEIPTTDPQAEAIFAALPADAAYTHLCRLQACYRARLSPKPWRIGLTRPGIPFPFTDASQEQAQAAWEAQYTSRSAEFSVCEHVADYGNGYVCEALRELLALHDAACGGGRKLA